MRDSQSEVTRLLAEWAEGDLSARQRLAPIVYDELNRLAAGFLRREPDENSLESAELVHEALLKLFDQRKAPDGGRERLMALVAQLMRRVLVDHARRKQAQRRGGAAATRITFDEELEKDRPALDVLDVHLALSRLAELDARQAAIVELRVFGGYTVEEVAGVLGISAATIKREWRTARIWLARELRRRN